MFQVAAHIYLFLTGLLELFYLLTMYVQFLWTYFVVLANFCSCMSHLFAQIDYFQLLHFEWVVFFYSLCPVVGTIFSVTFNILSLIQHLGIAIELRIAMWQRANTPLRTIILAEQFAEHIYIYVVVYAAISRITKYRGQFLWVFGAHGMVPTLLLREIAYNNFWRRKKRHQIV